MHVISADGVRRQSARASSQLSAFPPSVTQTILQGYREAANCGALTVSTVP